jgi:hypothetical protein
MARATPTLDVRGTRPAGCFADLLCVVHAFGKQDPRWTCDTRPASSISAPFYPNSAVRATSCQREVLLAML